MSNSSSCTRIDEIAPIPSNPATLSRSSTWGEDALTIAPAGERKGSLPRSDTLGTIVEPRVHGDAKEVAVVRHQSVSLESSHRIDESGNRRSWWHPVSLLWLAVENWFLISLAVLVTLAWRFPDVGKKGGGRSNPTIVVRRLTSSATCRIHRESDTPTGSLTIQINYGAIALIFLITGLTLSTQALYRQLRNWYSHLFTQVFSLLFFPAVMFAILNVIQAADDPAINPYILVGLMTMAVLPTTVAANVTMTREAEGNEEAAIAECCIGQVLGIFLSPLFLQMFMSAPGWAYGQPVASGGRSSAEGLKQIYRQVGQHMGLAIFLPMFVGQVIQKSAFLPQTPLPRMTSSVFQKKTKWVATTFRLPKVGSFLLLTLIWLVASWSWSYRPACADHC
jgi:sodium/bile acid cotransporter 7